MTLPEWFPLVVIDSLEALRRKSIVIERVFGLESVDGGVEITIVVGDDFPFSFAVFCTRNFGAISRRRTEPSNELSPCRSGVFCVSSLKCCCCSISHSCLYWLWYKIKFINGRLFSCKVRYKFSNKLIRVRSWKSKTQIKIFSKQKKNYLIYMKFLNCIRSTSRHFGVD